MEANSNEISLETKLNLISDVFKIVSCSKTKL